MTGTTDEKGTQIVSTPEGVGTTDDLSVTEPTDAVHRRRGSGVPARGYSWPPFEEGNEAALVHGARSPRKVQPIADELHGHLLSVAPWCASPAFQGAARSWSWAEGQAHLLRAHVDEHGHFDEEGEERSAVRTLERVERRLIRLREGLGLTPAALGKLLSSAATLATATGDTASLDALRTEGARILASRLTHDETATEPTLEGTHDDRPA